MSNPTFHGKRRPVIASSVLETAGDALLSIKMEDELRWADMGEILGVSEDQVAKYADGSAHMNIVTFCKAWAAWNGRFTGGLAKLVERAAPPVDAKVAQSAILKAALALSVALEDGELTDGEIRSNRSTLERAKDAIDAQLARLGPQQQVAA